jgi:hypothetical protein
MRVVGTIVGLCAGFAGVAAAGAADLPPARSIGLHHAPLDRGIGLHHAPRGHRAGETIIWASHPGIVTRPYWRAPWRHRHYYPVTGQRPLVGRDEDIDARAEGLETPETFSRTWTTSSAFLAEIPQRRGRDEVAPEPQPELPLK